MPKNKLEVRVKKLKSGAKLPLRATPGSAGADIFACLDGDVTIKPSETVMVPTGISMVIPEGFAGFIYARSGLASKIGVAPANKVGVIDSDYRGEVLVALHNHGPAAHTVSGGDRIAQLIVAPVVTADFILSDSLDATARGGGGFGSTGGK